MSNTLAEIRLPMAGSAIAHTHRVLATTILLSQLGSLERLTSIEIYLDERSPMSCPILRIRFVSALKRTSEFPMSYSTVKLPVLKKVGLGDLIAESMLTSIIAISALHQRATRMVKNLLSHYSKDN